MKDQQKVIDVVKQPNVFLHKWSQPRVEMFVSTELVLHTFDLLPVTNLRKNTLICFVSLALSKIKKLL